MSVRFSRTNIINLRVHTSQVLDNKERRTWRVMMPLRSISKLSVDWRILFLSSIQLTVSRHSMWNDCTPCAEFSSSLFASAFSCSSAHSWFSWNNQLNIKNIFQKFDSKTTLHDLIKKKSTDLYLLKLMNKKSICTILGTLLGHASCTVSRGMIILNNTGAGYSVF